MTAGLGLAGAGLALGTITLTFGASIGTLGVGGSPLEGLIGADAMSTPFLPAVQWVLQLSHHCQKALFEPTLQTSQCQCGNSDCRLVGWGLDQVLYPFHPP